MTNIAKLDTEMLEKVIRTLNKVKSEKPLVHCITNRVTIGDCANMLLAMGASPIMAEDDREVQEIVSICNGLVLNMGIAMTDPIVRAMKLAGAKAKELNIPIIFDPVGAGASRIRNEMVTMILNDIKPDVIRGNMSEIKAVSGYTIESKGVDASANDVVTTENMHELGNMVKDLASKYSCVVCATGETDIISNGKDVHFVKNGHKMLCDVTGTGCMCSAMTGATCAVGDNLVGAIAAVVQLGLAGEYAQNYVDSENSGIGTFRIKLLDYIYTLSDDEFNKGGKVYGG
ncbi:MAG: hydroxyethylthiazole kinase [Oscillospiraceae bacterium]